MDYVLGVLYATKKYEPLDTSRVNGSRGTSPPRQARAARLPSATAVPGVSGPAAEATNASMSDAETDTAHLTEDDLLSPNMAAGQSTRPMSLASTVKGHELAAALLTHAGSGPFPPSPPLLSRVPSSAVASGVRVPAVMLPSHFGDSRRPSASSVTSAGVPPSPSAAAGPPLEPPSVLSPLVPGLSSSLASHAPTIAAAATALGSATRPAPSSGGGRPQRLEYSVPTKAIAGKYVLLYLPPPRRPGESPAAALWGSHAGGAAAGGGAAGTGTNSMPGPAAGLGGSAPSSGPRNSATSASSAALQSPQLDPVKPRLGPGAAGAGAGATPNAFLGGVSPLTMTSSAAGPRPTFTTPLSKSVELSASSSTATAAASPVAGLHLGNGSSHNHHHSSSGGVAGPTSPARQAAVRAAAASVTTHQRLLLFYSLLLHRLARERPAALEASDDFEATGGGSRVPVAVLELQCTTEGPVRTSAAVAASGFGAGVLEGHSAALSVSPGATISGGAGGSGAASPPGGGGLSGLHAHGPTAGALSPRNGPYGARVGPAPPGSGLGGGSGYLSNTVSAMASPRGSTGAPLSANVHSEPLTGRAEEAAGQRGSGLVDLLGDATSDSATTQRLSAILRHLVEGQPDAWLSPDNVVFDSDITQNPWYGGWYSVESNDGYRRVMQMCGLRSWPAVVLVDPAGNIVTVEAMQHVEDELARFADDVDASIAKAKAAAVRAAATTLSTATPQPRSGSSAVPSRRGSGESRETPAAVSPHAVAGQSDGEHATTPPGEAAPVSADKSPSPPTPIKAPARDGQRQPSSPEDTSTGGNQAASVLAVATDRSGTHPLAAPLDGEDDGEAGSNPAATASSSSAAGNDSLSTPTRCGGFSEFGSVERHDPQIPTAEPTPVKSVPTTARYREESRSRHPTPPTNAATAASVTNLFPAAAAAAKSPLLALGSLSDMHFSGGTQQYQASPGRVEGADDEADVLTDGDGASAAAALGCPRLATDDDSESVRVDSRSADHGSVPTMRPSSQLSMPVLEQQPSQPGGGQAARSTTNFSPGNVSVTKGYGSLPSWDPKAYGGDVAGVLAVSEYDSDMDTPPHLGKGPASQVASSTIAISGGFMTITGAPAGAAGGMATGKAKTGTAGGPSVFIFSQPGTTDTHKIVDDFIAVVPGAAPISAALPVAPSLPAFSTGFPWNHVLAEPLMLYAPPLAAAPGAAAVAEAEEGHDAGTDAAKAEAPQRQSSHRRGGEADRARDEPSELERTTASSSTAGPAGARRSTTPSSSSPTATAVVPSAMVLRQAGLSQASSLLSIAGSPRTAGGLPCDQATTTSRESLTPRSGGILGQRAASTATTTTAAAAAGGSAQLELITFAESAPLTWTERQLPMHPLRRLAFCSVTMSEVRERSRQAASDAVLTTHVMNLGKAGEQHTLLATLTQETERQASEATPSESPAAPSLSLADSSDGASTRRSAGALRGGLPPSRQAPLLSGNVTTVPGVAAAGVSAVAGMDPTTQRIMARLMDTWQREAALKFEGCTHLLVLFGAGWHPAMPKFVRAVRRLCNSINAPAPPPRGNTGGGGGSGAGAGGGAAATGAAAGRGFGRGEDEADFAHIVGEVSGVAGVGGGMNLGSYDRCGSAEDDEMDTFASLRGYRSSPMDWAGGSAAALTSGGGGDGGGGGGFGETSSRLDMRGFGSFPRPSRGLGHAGFGDGEREGSSSPPAAVASRAAASPVAGAAASGQAASAAAAVLPQRRVQVIYISADDTLSGVCAATAEMPADWLCVSPHVAQSAPERTLQTHANEVARYIFHVKSFPRLVVVELPYAQQQPQQHAQPPTTPRGVAGGAGEGVPASVPNLSGAGRDECEEDLGDAAGTLTTLYATSATSQQVLEQQFEGLWTVLQQHGENHVYADPDGLNFPWASEPRDVLRLTQDDVSALSREGRWAWLTMMQGFRQHQDGTQTTAAAGFAASLQASPLLDSENPDNFDETALLQSHAELATAATTPTKRGVAGSSAASASAAAAIAAAMASGEDDTAALATTTASLLQSVTRLFPPIKTLSASDGELPSLLERGGYFVVLAAFGSVDAQLHQQCFSALDEVRRWFYAEVEARKQRAWSEPTPLQVMAPHGTYATSFTEGGDRVLLSPAHYSGAGGGGVGDEYGTPTRYSPGITASAVLSLTAGEHGLLHRHVPRNAAAFSGDEGWPEARGVATSPKYMTASPPMQGSGASPPLEGLHGLHAGGGPPSQQHRVAPPPAVSAAAAAAARPLPTVYFYDSILSHDAGDEADGRHAKLAGAAGAQRRATSPPQPTDGAERASPSPAPPPRVSDNTASLRRRHTKDLALLQEYVIAPILEADGKLLPVREGEVYLACVRWPQRTCAVLRRRLASEARPPATAAAPGQSSASGGGASLPSSSPSSAAATGGAGGALGPSTSPGHRSPASPQSPAQSQLRPEAAPRRPSSLPPTTTTTASPTPTSPTVPPALNASAPAAAGSSPASPASGLSAAPSLSTAATSPPASTVAGGAATETNSPSLGAVNPHASAATSLDNTLRTEGEGKEGSPDPDATPLLSPEAIKSFLHEHVLRSMDA